MIREQCRGEMGWKGLHSVCSHSFHWPRDGKSSHHKETLDRGGKFLSMQSLWYSASRSTRQFDPNRAFFSVQNRPMIWWNKCLIAVWSLICLIWWTGMSTTSVAYAHLRLHCQVQLSQWVNPCWLWHNQTPIFTTLHHSLPLLISYLTLESMPIPYYSLLLLQQRLLQRSIQFSSLLYVTIYYWLEAYPMPVYILLKKQKCVHVIFTAHVDMHIMCFHSCTHTHSICTHRCLWTQMHTHAHTRVHTQHTCTRIHGV